MSQPHRSAPALVGGSGGEVLRQVGVDEEGIGVAVEHGPAAVVLEQGPGPAQQVVAEAGDGAGQGALGEPAGAGGQHPVEGVHHDLAGVGGQLVAGGAGPGALLEEAGQHLGQDPGPAREEGAVGGAEQLSRHPGTVLRSPIGGLGARAAGLQVGQGIDVEGADDRGVQALEVEDEDVPVEPRPGGHDQAAR